MSMMKKAIPIALCAAVSLGAVRSASAVTAGTSETWESGTLAGWVCYDLVNERETARLSVVDGALVLTFKAQSMKTPPEEYVVKAASTASGGCFAGNYFEAGATLIRFRLKCSAAHRVSVLLRNETTGHLWRYRLRPVTPGEWTAVCVSLATSELEAVNVEKDAEAFAEDLVDVSWVGVSVERSGSMEAQTVSLDDFQVDGAGGDYGTWIGQFELAGGEALSTADPDGDGMDNYSEWVAGTAADDPDDCLMARIEDGSGSGVTVTWSPKPGRTYHVWRSETLPGGYDRISPEPGVDPPENGFLDASPPAGARFYRVSAERVTDEGSQ